MSLLDQSGQLSHRAKSRLEQESRNMQPRLWMATLGLALCLVAEPLIAGSFDDGLAAHQRADYTTALQIWEQLAEQGNSAAQYNLALMYTKAQGVPKNDAEALKWYRRAAGGGHAPAQLHLGLMYDKGLGVAQNFALAMKWHRLAAGQGDAAAQITLAEIYDIGRGVPQNFWQSVKWYQLAAEQGAAVAQRSLGVIFQEGRGVPKDYIQAYKWFSLANAAGDLNAAKKRDLIDQRMTREQVAQAQKLAREWMLTKAQERAAKCQAASLEGCN